MTTWLFSQFLTTLGPKGSCTRLRSHSTGFWYETIIIIWEYTGYMGGDECPLYIMWACEREANLKKISSPEAEKNCGIFPS